MVNLYKEYLIKDQHQTYFKHFYLHTNVNFINQCKFITQVYNNDETTSSIF